MFSPQRGPGVCVRCFNFTDGYERCYACSRQPDMLDVVAPISYSVGHEQLHHALASYKRLPGPVGRRLALQLAAVTWRYLARHEMCIARVAGVESFPVVTTVPPADPERADAHPLRWIVGDVIEATRGRYRCLLRRSTVEVSPHAYAQQKYECLEPISGAPVLLIDDTWTTGANAESAAAALKAAGVQVVAAVVIGRHINRDWHENDHHLRALAFDWGRCAWCRPSRPREASSVAPSPERRSAPV
jgi:hypothetical protein